MDTDTETVRVNRPLTSSLADLGDQPARPHPMTQEFLIFDHLTKLCIGDPRGLVRPATGNPESAPDHIYFVTKFSKFS